MGCHPMGARQGRFLSADVTPWLWGWLWQVTEAEEEEAKLFVLPPLVSHTPTPHSCVFSVLASPGEVRSVGPANNSERRRVIAQQARAKVPPEVCLTLEQI